MGLVLWTAAAAAVLLRLRGRPAAGWLGAASWSAAGLAVVVLAGAARLGTLAQGTDLAVVRRDGPLHSEPALGAEPSAPVQTSDVAHVLGRQHAWSRVRLDGGREGWIESERLESLDAR